MRCNVKLLFNFCEGFYTDTGAKSFQKKKLIDLFVVQYKRNQMKMSKSINILNVIRHVLKYHCEKREVY